MTIDPGRTNAVMMGMSVVLAAPRPLLVRGMKWHLSVRTRSSMPSTQLPSRRDPLLYFRLPNLLSFTSTTTPYPPSTTGFWNRNSAIQVNSFPTHTVCSDSTVYSTMFTLLLFLLEKAWMSQMNCVKVMFCSS